MPARYETVSTHVNPDEKRGIVRLAQVRGLTVSELLRDAVFSDPDYAPVPAHVPGQMALNLPAEIAGPAPLRPLSDHA